jgi:hypothetical protein
MIVFWLYQQYFGFYKTLKVSISFIVTQYVSGFRPSFQMTAERLKYVVNFVPHDGPKTKTYNIMTEARLIKFGCLHVKFNILYKGDDIRLSTWACYSWEMALNVGLDVSFDNMEEWKGIRNKAVEVNSTETYITIMELQTVFSTVLH